MIVFSSNMQVRRLSFWQKALTFVFLVPVLLALLPIGLFVLYRLRKQARQLAKEGFYDRQRTTVRVDDVGGPIIDIPPQRPSPESRPSLSAH